MTTEKEKPRKTKDRIEGNKIVLFDDLPYGSKILKSVEIHRHDGKICNYKLKRTRKGKYLFQ